MFYDVKKLIYYREKKIIVSNLRVAFDTLMKRDKISVIAKRQIPSIAKQSQNRNLLQNLLDLDYCNIHFHATQYPVLSLTPMHDKTGNLKSYVTPVFRIGRTNYYMSTQWNEDYVDLLLEWIWTNR